MKEKETDSFDPQRREEVNLVNKYLDEFSSEYTQAEIAKAIGVSASQLTKVKKGNYERSQISLGSILKVRKSLEELLERKKQGESIEAKETTLWQFFTTIPSKSCLYYWGGFILLLIVMLICCYFCIETKQKAEELFLKTKEAKEALEEIKVGFLLNLICSLVVPVIFFSLKATRSSGIKREVDESIKAFSNAWCYFWLSWVLLYLSLSIIYYGTKIVDGDLHHRLNINLLWAVADSLNLVNSVILLYLFAILYFKDFDRKLKWIMLPFIVLIGWLGIADKFILFEKKSIFSIINIYDGIGAEVISYLSGIAVLLVVGRLNSLFINIPFKLPFLIYLYLYALIQMKYGGENMTFWTVFIFLTGKMCLGYYVFAAFYRDSSSLEQYFSKVREEAS